MTSGIAEDVVQAGVKADVKLVKDVSLDKLIEAMIVVESGGDCNSVGKYGEVGPLQIMDICLEDYEQHNSRLIDRTNKEDSIAVCKWYLIHYGVHRGVKFEDLPRLWNGGPDGHTQKCTLGYQKKVLRVYNGL